MTISLLQRFTLWRSYLPLIGLLSVLMTTSCYPVKINEIVTLEQNGSGMALVTYGIHMPEALQPPQSRKLFEEVNEAARDTRGITAFDLRVSHNNLKENAQLVVYTASVRFDAPSSLTTLLENISRCPSVKPVLEQSGTSLLSSDWSMDSLLRPDRMTIRRKLPLPDAKGKPPVRMNLSAPDENGEKKEKDFLFLYTFPGKTENNNAQQTLNEGKTLLWSYDFDQLPQEPQYQTFTLNSWYLLPQNTLVGVAGILTGAILATVFSILRRIKKKKIANKPA